MKNQDHEIIEKQRYECQNAQGITSCCECESDLCPFSPDYNGGHEDECYSL